MSTDKPDSSIMQKPLIRPVENRVGIVQKLDVWIALAIHHRLAPAGMNAEHVARLHDDLLFLHNAHQLIVADEGALRAVAGEEVNQDAAPLHARLRHMLDPEIAPGPPGSCGPRMSMVAR